MESSGQKFLPVKKFLQIIHEEGETFRFLFRLSE